MNVDLSKLNEQEAEVLNNALAKILDNIKDQISETNGGRRTIVERLDEYDLWNLLSG